MRRTLEDFLAMELQDLFDDIINLEGGDLWDGLSTKAQQEETKRAKKAFGIKMRELGVRWE
jgi:hypothetical protein